MVYREQPPSVPTTLPRLVISVCTSHPHPHPPKDPHTPTNKLTNPFPQKQDDAPADGPAAFASYANPSPALQDLADFLTREGSFPSPSSNTAAAAGGAGSSILLEEELGEEEGLEGGGGFGGGVRPLNIATIEQMGALAIDEEAIRCVVGSG